MLRSSFRFFVLSSLVTSALACGFSGNNATRGDELGCYFLSAGVSCQQAWGDRLPNRGCYGCNSAHECQDPIKALISVPPSEWEKINGDGCLSGRGPGLYPDIDNGKLVCGKIVDCEIPCQLSGETGNWECVPETTNWQDWWVDSDTVSGEECTD